MTQPQGNLPGTFTAPKKTSPLPWILVGCAVIVLVGGVAVTAVLWWATIKQRATLKKRCSRAQGR